MKRLLWPIVTLTAFAGGFLAGYDRLHVPAEKPVTASTSAAAPAKPAAAELRGRLVDVLGVLNSSERSVQLQALAREEAQRDPAAAWAMRLSIAGVADREDFALEVLRVWASSDARAALNAATAMPAGRLRTAAVAAALEALAKRDPAAALAYAQEQLTGAAREEALTAAVRSWAAQDAPAAAQWALTNSSAPGASGTLRAAEIGRAHV